jgi:ribosomal protein L40E
MVEPESRYLQKKSISTYLTKKCPQCYAHLPLSAKTCSSCNAKVGEVDKLGFAQKPTDWLGYVLAGVSIIGFAVFVWWAFWRA